MEEEAVDVYKMAKELGFNPIGIHTHIGSGILDPEPFKLAVTVLIDIAGKVSEQADIQFDFIDFGGGIGIPYTPEESKLDINNFGEEITALYKSKLEEYELGKPTMCIEPGRYIVVADKPFSKPVQKIDIAGDVCESGDLFARDRMMPNIIEGDLLAILNAGACAFSIASQYNSRPRPAEILVSKGQSDIIRERETFSDVLAKQNIPMRLLK